MLWIALDRYEIECVEATDPRISFGARHRRLKQDYVVDVRPAQCPLVVAVAVYGKFVFLHPAAVEKLRGSWQRQNENTWKGMVPRGLQGCVMSIHGKWCSNQCRGWS